jgi:hypothetical protein
MNGGDLLIIGAGIAFVSALCFFFPGFAGFLFPPFGQDRGIAYVLGIISAFVLLLGLGQLASLVN